MIGKIVFGQVRFGTLSPSRSGSVGSTAMLMSNPISPDQNSVYVLDYGLTLTSYSRDAGGGLTYVGVSTLGTSGEAVACVISPDSKFVYALVTATNGGLVGNNIFQFSRDLTTGALTALTPVKVSTTTYDHSGTGEVYGMTISPDGAHLYVASADVTGTTAIILFSRSPTFGWLTYVGNVATGPFSSLTFSASGLFAYATDTIDARVYQYSVNTSTGALTALSPAYISFAMSFPLQIILSPDEAFAYVNGGGAGMLICTRNTSTGLLTVSSTFSVTVNTNCMVISPEGKSAYTLSGYSNQATQYDRDTSTGSLSFVSNLVVNTGSLGGYVAMSSSGTNLYVSGFSPLYTFNRVVMT
jgi:6-phosphogluconolactonase (cycloisomerase 2 family)